MNEESSSEPSSEAAPAEAPITVVPTMGRIVNYVTAKGTVRAAMIIRVWGTTPEALCNLRVFTDFANDANFHDTEHLDPELVGGLMTGIAYVTSRKQSAGPKPGHWHFPPRV